METPFTIYRQFVADGITYMSGEVWEGTAEIAGIGRDGAPIIADIRVNAWRCKEVPGASRWCEVSVPRGCDVWAEIATQLAADATLAERFDEHQAEFRPRRPSYADEHRLSRAQLGG